MSLFEGYERRIDKINGVLKEYGISSVEECRDICLSKGVDCDKIVRGTQPICFENAVWAYTAGADVSHVRKQSDTPTGIAMIIVTENNNRIILDKGANACLTKEDIDEFLKDAGESDVYLTQLENPIDIVGYGLKKAKEKGMYTVLNPAPADQKIAEYFEYVDLITPNESELALFGGKSILFSAGIRKIVTTLGSKGYEIADENGAKIYPCIKVKAIDTTAAGDTLCGGLCAYLSEGKTLEEACAFGSRAASIACTRVGAQQSVPTREEVENYR